MMKNCKMVEFSEKTDGRGKLIPIEYPKQLEFPIKRIYYIYDVGEGVTRGYHSHKDLEQVLIAIHGKIKVRVKTPYEEEVVELTDPSQGLYIGPMVWREMFDFEDEGVLLVLASHEYDEADYIRDINEYTKLAIEYFDEDMKVKKRSK